jgi:hypothetical protein
MGRNTAYHREKKLETEPERIMPLSDVREKFGLQTMTAVGSTSEEVCAHHRKRDQIVDRHCQAGERGAGLSL